MSFSIYDASAPIMVRAMKNMIRWLDKAQAAGLDESKIMEARLAEDMRPFPFQFQTCSDTAKFAVSVA